MRPARAARAALAALALALASAAPDAASARGFAVEDILRIEGFGQRLISPDQRWLVLERRLPYATASRFDYDRWGHIFRTEVDVVDLSAPAPATPLFPREPGVGYAVDSFSPDGRRLAVFRLKDEVWELGIAELETRRVTWTGVRPEAAEVGQVVQWLSPRALAILEAPPGRAPFLFRYLRPQSALVGRWAQTAAGGAAYTRVGSGRYAALNPRDPPKRLVTLDVETGVIAPLAAGDFSDFEVAPDGRTVAVLEAGEDIPLRADQPIQGPYGIALRRQRLLLLDVRTHEERRPAPGWDMLAQLLSWSADGGRLLVYMRPDGAPWTEGRLAVVGRSGKDVARLPADEVAPLVVSRPEVVRAGWLGRRPIVYGRGPGGVVSWWRLEPGRVRNLAAAGAAGADGLVVAGRTLLLPTSDGVLRAGPGGPAARQLIPGVSPLFPFREGLMRRHGWTFAERSTLVGSRQGPLGPEAVEVGADGQARHLPLPPGATLLDYAPARGALVRETLGGGADRLEWIDNDGRRAELATINRHLMAVERPEVRAVAHTGPGGEALTSWLVLPAREDPQHPPPLVVYPYLGQSFRTPPSYLDPRESPGIDVPRLLAGHGYAVLLPSLPVPPGPGLPDDRLAQRVLDIIAAAAAAPGTRGTFDEGRLGVWGHSFGGYSTLALIGQTDRFAAAVAVASISNLFSKWGDFGPPRRLAPEQGLPNSGYTEDLQPDMRGPPWRRAERYLAGSPALQLDNARTPLLLVHGDQDGIQLSQSEQVFSVYQRDNRDAELITFWGEGHVMLSPANMAHYLRSGLSWMDVHLAFAPPAEDAQPQRRNQASTAK